MSNPHIPESVRALVESFKPQPDTDASQRRAERQAELTAAHRARVADEFRILALARERLKSMFKR